MTYESEYNYYDAEHMYSVDVHGAHLSLLW